MNSVNRNTIVDSTNQNAFVDVHDLAKILEAVPDCIFVKNEDLRFIYVNKNLVNFLGHSAEDMVGKSDYDFFPKEQADLYTQGDKTLLNSDQKTLVTENTISSADGSQFIIEAKKYVTKLSCGETIIVGIFRDITELRKTQSELKVANGKLHKQLILDPLCGILNRTGFYEYLNSLSMSKTTKQFTLIFLDLDNFKQINDVHGHGVGDKVLEYVARYLSSITRKSDCAARLGGDEFVLLLNTGRPNVVSRVKQQLKEHSTREVNIEGLSLHLSISFGLASYPADSNEINELMRLADKNMYKNKLKNKTLQLNS